MKRMTLILFLLGLVWLFVPRPDPQPERPEPVVTAAEKSIAQPLVADRREIAAPAASK